MEQLLKLNKLKLMKIESELSSISENKAALRVNNWRKSQNKTN